ncbi:hypothetical protein ACVNIS_02760 [Sphaerotilaceae bacterium SBD11-9]
MNTFYRAAVSALSALALVGCATRPNQPLDRKVVSVMQPMDVKIGIRQPELVGDFEVSRAGQAAAAGCGAVPGIGILLAAACGAAAGAVDASVNASRAKTADETIRPLKDEIVDVKVDKAINDAIAQALKNAQDVRFSDIVVTKETTDDDYETLYKASTAGSVMFVNINYSMSIDLSTLQLSARALLYPRSPAARTAAGLSPEFNAATDQGPMLAMSNAAYRSMLFYRAKLPTQAENPTDHIATWKANHGQLLRTSINDGIAQLSRLLAEDLLRSPGAERPSLGTVEGLNGQEADLVAESHGGKLLRYKSGALHFHTTLAVNPPPMSAAAQAPAVATQAAAR